MKESTESIRHSVFSHFPPDHENRNQVGIFFDLLKKHAFSLKDQILDGFITLGIGTILLVSIYLFLIQLAEYGWQ